MTQASAPMQIKAWRIAGHDAPMPGPRARLLHDHDRLAVVAYETPELASLCTFESLADQPALLRETLLMPGDASLHRRLTLAATGAWNDTPDTQREFFRYLKRNGLLSVWVPSEMAENQHLLLIDPEHPAYGAIQTEMRYTTLRAHDGGASGLSGGRGLTLPAGLPAFVPDAATPLYARLHA
ncbi:MAG: hypothetical protein EOP93_16335 [Lysobacteraceae bacterium]|nr:MAG: hypothetical protein EOP93_16335 [Xanthomonadaceae bacterium]